ncbi:MAG: helix-turn-helix transcriptional regulator [Bdellovibrionales bacterium]|nr:helix-turn-helix transcriptional regulator [Bdellovibrionales bacterium]
MTNNNNFDKIHPKMELKIFLRETQVRSDLNMDAQDSLKAILAVVRSIHPFSEYLEYYLSAKGTRPRALARSAGYDASTIAHWRKRRRLPDGAALYRISRTLNLTNTQSQQFLLAWIVTRIMRDMEAYVEAALKDDPCDAEFVQNLLSVIRGFSDSI